MADDKAESGENLTRQARRKRRARVLDIVDEVVDLDQAEQEAQIRALCEGDTGLEQAVVRWLAVDSQIQFLESPVVSVHEMDRDSLLGQKVGRYRIDCVLGEGGMGYVYLGIREDGEFQQKVAVKVLRRGAPGSDLFERFAGERQVLSDLIHPNIARLYDGGSTEDGRPYLAMEVVEGVPLDAYCTHLDLGVRARLELFLKVCSAVEFANRRLVVHRDIKPSNILVNDEGEPKLLDFGIAKSLEPAGVTITRSGERPMTPAYASPEQAQGLEAITVATDVYSLGVVLYELLTGKLPYSFPSKAQADVVEAICKAAPRRPSSALLHDEDRRFVVSDVFSRSLRGDLDVIVLKALRKEPDRRYGSVEALAADIRRHLDDLPVLARGDSWQYKAGKFFRRNVVPLLAAALVVFFAGAFLVNTVLNARALEHERDKAELERDRAEQVVLMLTNAMKSVDPRNVGAEEVTLRMVLEKSAAIVEDELAGQPAVQATILNVVGEVYTGLGLYEQAEQELRRSLRLGEAFLEADDSAVATAQRNLGITLYFRGELEAAENLLRASLDSFSREKSASTLATLSTILIAKGANGEADMMCREVLALTEASASINLQVRSRVVALHNLAVILGRRGETEEAIALEEEALSIQREIHGEVHPDVAAGLCNLGMIMSEAERPGAEAAFGDCARVLEQLYPEGHSDQLYPLFGLARLAQARADYDEALKLTTQAIEIGGRHLGRDHLVLIRPLTLRANALARLGNHEQAVDGLGEATRVACMTVQDADRRRIYLKEIEAVYAAIDSDVEGVACAVNGTIGRSNDG